MEKRFEFADYVSDRIVDALIECMKDLRFNPVELFAGQMLAFMSLLETAERLPQPPEMVAVRVAVERCLESIFREPATRP